MYAQLFEESGVLVKTFSKPGCYYYDSKGQHTAPIGIILVMPEPCTRVLEVPSDDLCVPEAIRVSQFDRVCWVGSRSSICLPGEENTQPCLIEVNADGSPIDTEEETTHWVDTQHPLDLSFPSCGAIHFQTHRRAVMTVLVDPPL